MKRAHRAIHLLLAVMLMLGVMALLTSAWLMQGGQS